MSSIELTTWGHAGIRLERDGARLAVDPGAFTDPRVLDGATAVLITHEHPDHVVPDRLAPVLAGSGAEVWAPTPVAEALLAAGASAGRVRTVAPGEEFAAAGFAVRTLGGSHAVVHPALAPVANVAYLLDGVVLHPGDSFTPVPGGTAVRVLALPVSAPWMKVAEAVDYALQVSPDTVVPIHDAMLTDAGRALVDRVVGGLTGRSTYRRLAPGEPIAVETG